MKSMDDLIAHLIGIFQQKVHIHQSRARGEEAIIQRAVHGQGWLALRYLLREMSHDPFPDDDPVFSYPKGMIHWGEGTRDEALALLDNATRHYTAQGQDDYAALCQIESADICHERGEFLSALHALDRARLFLDRSPRPEPRIQARLWLLEAVLAGETGQMKDGVSPAQKAHSTFHLAGDANSEFLSLMLLANLHIHQGYLAAGRSFLVQARRCFASGPVLARYEVRLGNSEVHLAWYGGELEKALAECLKLQRLCTRRGMDAQLVYAYEMEGNLQWAVGRFAQAERAYAAALEIAQKEGLLSLQRWVWVNRAWLCLLRGQGDAARHLLETASRQAESAVQMGLQVSGAVLHLLAGHTAAAERALLTSRAYYQQAGEGLAVCAVDFHLVHLHLRTDRRTAARQRLGEALEWMEQTGVDYFPHWWHPGTVYNVLRFGEDALPAHRGLIHRMLRRHIGKEAQSARGEAVEASDFSSGAVEKLLQPVTAPGVRGVLKELLTSGELRASGFPALCQALDNGEEADARAFLLCAIFGLYVSDVPRKEIAVRINESEAVVRHAIRQIYERLVPELLEMTSTKARKIGLGQRARETGYVDGVG
jgi:tetratricopeptide (TPR) repeat protein